MPHSSVVVASSSAGRQQNVSEPHCTGAVSAPLPSLAPLFLYAVAIVELHPGIDDLDESSSHPGSCLHCTPEHASRCGKHDERAQLVHEDECGLRQWKIQAALVQDASPTQQPAQFDEKPRPATQPSMQPVPETMHLNAHAWMSP